MNFCSYRKKKKKKKKKNFDQLFPPLTEVLIYRFSFCHFCQFKLFSSHSFSFFDQLFPPLTEVLIYRFSFCHFCQFKLFSSHSFSFFGQLFPPLTEVLIFRFSFCHFCQFKLFSSHSFSFFTTCARKFMFSLSAAFSHNLTIYEYLTVAPSSVERVLFSSVILPSAKCFRRFHHSWLKQNDSGSPEKFSTFFSCWFGGRIGGFFGIPSSLFHR